MLHLPCHSSSSLEVSDPYSFWSPPPLYSPWSTAVTLFPLCLKVQEAGPAGTGHKCWPKTHGSPARPQLKILPEQQSRQRLSQQATGPVLLHLGNRKAQHLLHHSHSSLRMEAKPVLLRTCIISAGSWREQLATLMERWKGTAFHKLGAAPLFLWAVSAPFH